MRYSQPELKMQQLKQMKWHIKNVGNFLFWLLNADSVR